MDNSNETKLTLEQLSAKIAGLRQSDVWEDKPNEPHANSSVALNMVAELVATVAVGGVGGYYLDKYFNSKPAFLLCGLLVGGIAGIIGIKRINDAYVRTIDDDIIKDVIVGDEVLRDEVPQDILSNQGDEQNK